MAHNEVYLRCAQLANARVLGNLATTSPLQDHAEERRGHHCGDGLGRRALHGPQGPGYPEAHALPPDRPGGQRRPASRVLRCCTHFIKWNRPNKRRRRKRRKRRKRRTLRRHRNRNGGAGPKNKPKQDPTEPAAPSASQSRLRLRRRKHQHRLRHRRRHRLRHHRLRRLSSQESSSAPRACWRGSPLRPADHRRKRTSVKA